MSFHALGNFNLHFPPQPYIVNFQINTTISYTHLHFLHASLAQQSTPAVPTIRSSRHSQFTTRSSCNLVLSLAHRDWQRSPRSGAVAAAFIKLKIQWMYIIKTRSLTVSYNLTTDIGVWIRFFQSHKIEYQIDLVKWKNISCNGFGWKIL